MNSFEEIIQFAIHHEEEEANFYEDLAQRSKSADQKKALLEQAAEERDHKRRLEEILTTQQLPKNASHYQAPTDMNLDDYIHPQSAADGSVSYEDALLMAVKRERTSQKLYQTLAEKMSNPGLKKSLLFLSEQEGKHASQLEATYDDSLSDN